MGEKYVKQLGKVLKTKNVGKLTEFVAKERPELGFQNATYQVREITLWKMIANRADMPRKLHDEACEWLKEHGYDTNLEVQ